MQEIANKRSGVFLAPYLAESSMIGHRGGI